MKKWDLAFLRLAAISLAGLASLGRVTAAPIMVENFSFETPVQADGGFNQGPGSITGWVNDNTSGVFAATPGVYFNYIPDGRQVGYNANSGSDISQVLSATLQDNMTYTLRVDVGHRLDINQYGAVVELLAGSTVIATAPLPADPGSGNFATATATYTSGAADALAGQTLEIVLGGTDNVISNYDNVRLDASAPNALPSAAPEPTTWGLVGASLLGYGLRKCRARRQNPA